MKSLRVFRRPLSVFLLIFLTCQLAMPTVSYALTAGPTAPEFSSFEPVDTTDMVSLATGDFTYNAPLIEVPGPAGGYPLSLSYHAGIQPGQEASWVGLGWTLNPGSISRMVNGYPDDHETVAGVTRTFWEGGETSSSTVGVTFGVANVASVGASLEFAHDTYKGFDIGTEVSGRIGPVQASASLGPYGQTSEYIGLSYTHMLKFSENATAGIGGSVGFANTGDGFRFTGRGGLTIGSNALHASINSDGSFGIGDKNNSFSGAVSGVHNSKSHNISSTSSGFNVEFPVYYGINLRLGQQYRRYWIDEKATVSTYGSLYIPGGSTENFSKAFDVYDLLDRNLDAATYSDGEKVIGGSFPDYDSYTVMGQGIGGIIQPTLFAQEIFRQDKDEETNDGYTVFNKSYKLTDQVGLRNATFRFVGDFSNKFKYDEGNLEVNSGNVSYEFTDTYETGEDGESAFIDGNLAGSNHVEWYTNHEIRGESLTKDPFVLGFIDTSSEGFERPSNSQIGGFTITNRSGVNYHYALPALSSGEFMRYMRYDEANKLYQNDLSKSTPYAYNWMLTAVTGPDYVDVNHNGKADHGDLGYWVNFHYKKYLNDYRWRNPGTGANRDIDTDFTFYSAGTKQIYYLERIVTDSHVAVFEKSLRFDGRESKSRDEGGFDPTPVYAGGECYEQCAANCQQLYCDLGDCDNEGLLACTNECTSCPPSSYTNFPRPSMKLDRIRLYNYSDWESSRTSDKYVLKQIEFNYSYNLALGTPNSYDQDNYPSETVLGKLTLESITSAGKGAVSLIPPITFGYGYNPSLADPEMKDAWGYYKSDYEVGDNEALSRLTTTTSAANVKAWSLTSIETPVGTNINIIYESDEYEDVALARRQLLRTKYVTDYAANQLKINFWEDDVDLSQYFAANDIIKLDLIGTFYNKDSNFDCDGCPIDLDDIAPAYVPILFDDEVTVTQVDAVNKFIVVENSALYNRLKLEDKVVQQRVIVGTVLYAYTLTFTGSQKWPDFIPAGFVSGDEHAYGGGLRVKSITASAGTESSKTTYNYFNGTTSYEPFAILSPLIIPEYEAVVSSTPGTRTRFKQAVLKGFSGTFNISRECPGPGVMYGRVEVRGEITSDGVTTPVPNYTAYEFETFREGLVEITKNDVTNYANQGGSYEGMAYDVINTANLALKDFSSRVGNLKTITTYREVNDEPVTRVTNVYAHDSFDTYEDNVTEYEPLLTGTYNDQGVLQETFAKGKLVLYKKGDRVPYNVTSDDDDGYFDHDEYRLLAILNKRITFPSIKIGQITKDYTTNIQTETRTKKFDFYSGLPIETINTDSYGNRFLTKTEPAYRKYPNMGLRVNGVGNKNMLTQGAASFLFKIGSADTPTGLLSAGVQTWSNGVDILGMSPQTNIWRTHKTYQWDGEQPPGTDGTYPISHFNSHPFDFDDTDGDDQWQLTSEVTLYDHNSNQLEAKDMNGNYHSIRMDKEHTRVLAAAANARYDEMAYSGAEGMPGNSEKEAGVSRGSGAPTNARAHTGKYSLLVNSGSQGFTYTLEDEGNAELDRNYHASVWVYVPGEGESATELKKVKLSVLINGQEKIAYAIPQKNKSKSWYQLNLDFNPGGYEAIIKVSNGSPRGAYFDDFRIHPSDGPLISYVYDPFSKELTDILDGNNFYTHFEYDVHGRLIKSTKEVLNFDFGPGNESYRADKIQAEVRYNYGKNQ